MLWPAIALKGHRVATGQREYLVKSTASVELTASLNETAMAKSSALTETIDGAVTSELLPSVAKPRCNYAHRCAGNIFEAGPFDSQSHTLSGRQKIGGKQSSFFGSRVVRKGGRHKGAVVNP